MLQIIDGKRYNTETAEHLAEARGGGGCSDFHHWEEELYRTPKGVYFLAGSGGPMTSWSRRTADNMTAGGEGIRVLTEAEAREWVERYANDEYERIFGAAEEA